MPQTTDEIINLIRSKKDDMNLTYDRLAELSGVGRKTLEKLLNGHNSPKLETLLPVFGVLGIEIRNEKLQNP